MELPSSRGTGVYMIVNVSNNKKYVGSTATGFRKRATNHRTLLRKGTHPNVHLQRAWNKYGEGRFRFVILQRCVPVECVAAEQRWIDKLGVYTTGYNRNPTAGSRLGVHLSEETKAKISCAKAGTKMSQECRARMSQSRTGLVKSRETCEKLKANHWSKGPRAAEIAARIAEANRGRLCSEETKVKISTTKKKGYVQ